MFSSNYFQKRGIFRVKIHDFGQYFGNFEIFDFILLYKEEISKSSKQKMLETSKTSSQKHPKAPKINTTENVLNPQ